MGFNVEGLKEYINETKNELIRKSTLGAPTIKYLQLQTGVVGKQTINLINTTVSLQDGRTCGFNSEGETTISQRTLDPALIKVQNSWCDKDLAKYFLNHEIRVAAGQAKLPAEQQIIADMLDGTAEALEDFIWAEDNVIGGSHYKGFIGLAKEGEFKTAEKGATMWETVRNVYKAIPAKTLKTTKIFMGINEFRELIDELTQKNLYHYAPVDSVPDSFEMVLPGTVTKVVAVPGLDGKNAIIALDTSKAFYGTDMQNDNEIYDFWYSQDNRDFRYDSEFAACVQVAYPEDNVYCDLAAV